MNESTHKEVHDDENQPATKGDVRRSQEELASMMANSFEHVATKDQLATVLDVVQSIDQKLTGLPEKVERLTKAVFPHR